MKRFFLVVLFLGLSLSVACAAAARDANLSAVPVPAGAPQLFEKSDAQLPSQTAGVSTSAGDQTLTIALNQASTERMVVYTGSMSLEVEDTEATVAQVADILKANQGYIASRSLTRGGSGKVRGSITIRVPAAAMDTTLKQIKVLAIKPLREDSKSEDVTQEYTDLDARRKNLEAYEVELTKLLETVRERTGKAEDILAVYNQLTEVRGQIEQIKGRQNYLQNTSSLATYTIEFVPREEVVEAGWDPGNTARNALRSLAQALQGLADLGISFVLFLLPILIVLALPFVIFFWLVRYWWRRRSVKRAAK